MEFCDICSSIMLPLKTKKQSFLECKNCGHRKRKILKNFKIWHKPKHEKILVVERDTTNLPVTHKMCPKCSNEKAYWWVQQTRSGDEPPTQFFKCFNGRCRHVWREY